MATPKVILAGKPKVVRAGKPKVILTNTNVHPAGIPKVVMAGVPKVCSPGQDGFSIPKVVPVIDSPLLAGIPEVVIAKEAYSKDQNPQNFSSFGKLQGLKHGHITCLSEDKSGNLWIGTNGGGVSKYDGKSFTHFTEKEGLGKNDVRSILADRSDNLWFGTYGGGVSKYDGKSFTNYTEKQGLSNNIVYSILEDNIGNLWFGTGGGGVIKYDPDFIGSVSASGKSFTHYTEKEGLISNVIYSILKDRSGNLWIGGDRGVSKYDGKTFTNFTEKEGLSNRDIRTMLEDRNGSLWFGTYGGGVIKFDASGDAASNDAGKRFTHYTEKDGLNNNYVLSILEDKSGNFWFSTYGGGISKFDGKSFTHYTEKEGLSNNVVWSILEDKTGNLWFATGGGGVSKYRGINFTHYSENEGLINNAVWSMLEDKNGNLWLGTSSGVSKYELSIGRISKQAGGTAGGKNFTHYTEKDGLSNNIVLSILEDRSGNLWFGTYGGGVSKYDGKRFTNYTEKEGLINNDIRSILEDKSDNLWFGTGSGGVCKFDGKNFTHYTDKEGLSNNNVRSMLEDKIGNLWFGTVGGGVSRFDPNAEGGKNFTHFTEKEGLNNNVVWTILQDKNGNLWFGTEGGGVSKYDGKSFTYYTEKEGLSNNFVGSILEDKSGNIWLGTRFGLSKLEKNKSAYTIPKELAMKDKIVEDPSRWQLANNQDNIIDELFFRTYTYEDGFSGFGINFGKTICEAKDGTIWIGANDRLTALRPGREIQDTIAPNMQLIGLALFNENIPWQNLESPSIGDGRSPPDSYRGYREEAKKDTSFVLGNGIRVHDFHFDGVSRWYGTPEHLSLAYNNNNLTFQFVGITLQAPKKVKYQYKLEGLDKNWSTITNRSEATYGNLGQGKYTFKVKAMNGEGYWSKELAYAFVIRPPWWLTWWAYGIYGLLLGVAVLLVHRYQKQRIVRIEQEKAQKKELELGKEIEKAYTNLKATQSQLIQSEKMASLGELTAGIAHEIQNPLNFINNFSDVSTELLNEMKAELLNGNADEAIVIAANIEQNLEKINLHGSRADAIVKGMLLHSRNTRGIKEPTDINALADEYLRLSYHGLRAKDNTFNAAMETDFDRTIGKINIIPQDIGRVLLNLINNAFYAVSERKKQNVEGYEPTVSVSTKKIGDSEAKLAIGSSEVELAAKRMPPGSPPYKVLISVRDNGNGIPQKVLDKIFQPFFTTKPTGQGTGLGLSLAYDIIKAHGGSINVISNYNEPGDIKVESEERVGTEFIVSLPI